MFLINSRRPLVIATYKPLLDVISEKNVGIPSPEVTGLTCRIPLLWFSCHALAFSARGTCTGSRYDHAACFLRCFQWLMDSACFSQLEQMLFTTKLLCPDLVKHPKNLVPSLSASVERKLVLPRAAARHTNINAFPFPHNSPLRVGLGSAYSWSISVAKKPVPFRRWRFSLQIDATSAKIFIAVQSTSLRKLASAQTARPSTKSTLVGVVPQYR